MKTIITKIKKTSAILKSQSLIFVKDIENVMFTECGYKQNNTPPKDGWKPFPKGTRISGYDKHFWFKLNFRTPDCQDNRYPVLTSKTGYEGQRDTVNPQSMVFVNGELCQAMDTNHTQVRLQKNTDYEIYIYYYMGSVKESCEFDLGLSFVDEPVRDLYYDISVPFNACKTVYTENSYEYANTVKVLERACNIIDLNYPYTPEYYEKIVQASKLLKNEYYEKLCGNNPVTVDCIGHTHIDVAWLWTLAQTREKVERSFATVIELMKYYPEYKFMMSQPQLFKYLSEVNKDMYAKIKELVKSGRWEMEGAMWLEADCNLTSGESLVRQIQHGKKFLKDEFGVDSKVLWLPDVFGYSAAMPQILKKCGITHFVTSKISWNDTNIMPDDTFMWQGIDGTEIITDFITAQDFKRNGEFANETTYVGLITPSMVAGTWNRYQNKEYNDNVMLVYGWGDGGGGPTEDMLLQQRRLSYGLPGLPKTRMSSLKEHLETVEENFFNNCKEIGRTPKWVGELYLEFHRGTYTSMARNKRYNRFAEMRMQKSESLSAINSLLTGAFYDKKGYYDLWETILLNQFHDILPGSSVSEVYEDSHAQYDAVFEKSSQMLNSALESIAENVDAEGGILVYNSLGFARNGIINVNGKFYETGLVPSYGFKVIDGLKTDNKVFVKENVAENDFFMLQLNESGFISKLFDKRHNRNVFKADKCGNELQIFEDMPYNYENWEISNYYESKGFILSDKAEITAVDEGCRKGFKIEKKYKNSTVCQFIYLYDSIERIDVVNVIDWHEHQQLLKIAFPFNVHSNKAVYDIQFGNIERNTHQNTSWDAAKFETCAHKWVDISEYGFGVSLLNDCKYGFSAKENVLKLTAVKCGIYPNKEADQGLHEFTYSIYPHSGDFRVGNTVREAYSLNQSLIQTPVKPNSHKKVKRDFSLLETGSDNIFIETVKQAEASDDLIVRLYDAYNCRTNADVKFGIPVEKVYLCDLLENEVSELPVFDNTVNIPVGNYEIVTLKVIVKA